MPGLDPERRRLTEDGAAWRRWGPYLSERAWGTVREDYSAGGEAWSSFPHDHARSRAYRWNEDGLGGICDDDQRLCLAFAFWNGADPILKERVFGLTSTEGNHGEDAKEYWWYLDSTPTHSWMRWRYVYPQAAFPYEALLRENAARGRLDREYELLDTGVFDDDRYWDVEATYAKAAPDDVCIVLRVRNAGAQEATLHVLPTLWFRNRWSWERDVAAPTIRLVEGALDAGELKLAGDGAPDALFCENETNTARLWGEPGPACPKDGINDHVLHGAATVSDSGSKAALWYRLTVAGGETAEIRLRLAPDARSLAFDDVLRARSGEADAFYAALAPKASEEEQTILRQAFGGLLWSKQFYHYDVNRWLAGDPGQPAPPPDRHTGRNAHWRHIDNRDIISMPDKWEYPWYAAWDLAFHCIALAHVDPEFAKEQLRLITREWYMHPNGQLPAYEWNFGDVNPPVHALAALAVFELDGGTDREWLGKVFHKLLLGFTWWANLKDPDGNFLYGGGFLGMDNVGPFDRSAALPDGLELEQADGTGWMALYCLSMLEIALVLANHDRTYEDVALKFFENFTMITQAVNDHGLWDEQDGFYYDRLRRPSGDSVPVRVRSMTGLIPLCAVAIGEAAPELTDFRTRVEEFLRARPEYAPAVQPGGNGHPTMLALVGRNRLPRIMARVADEAEFLSPHGLRALSAEYRDAPYVLHEGHLDTSVDYEPAESTTGLYGGNSNWRGPVWFPVNHLVIGALERFAAALGDDVTVEFPTGSGAMLTLREVVGELSRRLISIFLPGPDGRRPVWGDSERFQKDPAWRDSLLFYEYFHGDDGAGLGASHQTGWTGLVADLIIRTRA